MIKHIFLGTLLSLLISSCARVGNPDGGDKDITPPKLLKANPENKSVNFKSKEIKLIFDEFVVLKDIQKNLLISPPLDQMPSISPMGVASKEVIIKFSEELSANTTYIINFGKAIVDNNEGNLFGNYQYVFSTGKKIDSLQISGKVTPLYFEKTPENMMVGLYLKNNFNDSLVYKQKPFYIGLVDKLGNYTISNIRSGDYKIIALADKNRNYLYNKQKEAIGFLEKTIHIPADTIVNLSLFKEKTKFSVEKIEQLSANHITISYKGEKNELILQNKIKVDKEINYYNQNKYHYWYKSSLDSIKIFITSGKYEKKFIKKRKKQTDSLFVKIKPRGIIQILDTIAIVGNIPLQKIDTTKVFIFEKDSIPISFSTKINKQFGYDLKFKRKEKTKYKLVVYPNAVTDLLNNKNKDTISVTLKTTSLDSYGTLTIEVENKEKKPYFIELLNLHGKVYKSSETTTGKSVELKYLKPGNYSVRIVFDSNQNNKWDTGDYLKHQKPELTINFNKNIEIRANWEMNQKYKW